MKIETIPAAGAVVLKVSGRLDAGNVPVFDEACEDCLRGGLTHVVVDLSQVDYIGSAGVHSFLTVGKALQMNNGSLILSGVHGVVKEVFDMTRLTTLFPVFDTPDSALRSI